MAAKIRRNDKVVVIAGKNKGSTGVVTLVLSGNKVIVEGINLVKKHQKANPQLGVQGGIIEKEAPIDVSNLAIVNPKSGKADKVGFRFEDGKKVRFFKSDNEIVK